MREYNKVIFFKNKSDADKMYSYILDYISRSYLFVNIEGNILDTNIYYENNRYYLVYHLEDFKKIRIGDSKKFYLPSWAKLKVYSNGLIDGYGNAIDSFESELSGYYLFKKIDNRRRAVLLGNIKICDYDSLMKLEALDKLYDAESITIKANTYKGEKTLSRNNAYMIIFRLLQRPRYSQYKISIEINTCHLLKFFQQDFAYLKSSTWAERQFMLDLDPVEILVSSKYYYNTDTFFDRHNTFKDLKTWDEIVSYINKNDSSLRKYLKKYDNEKHEIYLYYNDKPKFIIKLKDLKEKGK